MKSYYPRSRLIKSKSRTFYPSIYLNHYRSVSEAHDCRGILYSRSLYVPPTRRRDIEDHVGVIAWDISRSDHHRKPSRILSLMILIISRSTGTYARLTWVYSNHVSARSRSRYGDHMLSEQCRRARGAVRL